MFKFAPYVLKSLWRHRSRTLLTVSGSAVALFVFGFVAAVQQGLARLTDGQLAQRTLIVFQESRFCPASSRLPQDYANDVLKVSGVRDVVPIKVYTNNCRASLDVVVFHGMPPQKLHSARRFELRSGNWSDFESRSDAALVGQAVAARRGLSVGERFTIGDVTVMVAGVFQSAQPEEDSFVFTHLDFLQRAGGQNGVGMVTQLEVLLSDGADPDQVAGRIDQQFKSGPVATATRTKGIFQRDTMADLAELIAMAHWLGYACLGLVLSLVATTSVMAVQDRIHEHAILQTLGLRPGRIFRLVLAESVLQSVTGGLIGTGAALALLSWGGFAIGAEGVTIAFLPSPELAVTGLALSALVGLVAGIAPGWQAARTEIVPALRFG